MGERAAAVMGPGDAIGVGHVDGGVPAPSGGVGKIHICTYIHAISYIVNT